MTAKKLAQALIAGLLASAFTATAAVAAEWKIAGAAIPAAGEALIEPTAIVEEPEIVSAELNVRIKCKGLNLKKAKIVPANTGSVESLALTGCTELEPAKCKTEAELASEPLVLTVALGAVPKDKLVIAPAAGKTLMAISFLGGECAIAGEKPLNGEMTVTLPEGQTELVKQEVVANTPAGELMLGGKSATLKGKATVEVKGSKNWSYK
ncbi:MAG TPA: hypothetical protein VK756_02305 [Solirubrobacteraceae bacterium]|nr:hypothetical protein [Solirubrobacteraceae bacterium]